MGRTTEWRQAGQARRRVRKPSVPVTTAHPLAMTRSGISFASSPVRPRKRCSNGERIHRGAQKYHRLHPASILDSRGCVAFESQPKDNPSLDQSWRTPGTSPRTANPYQRTRSRGLRQSKAGSMTNNIHVCIFMNTIFCLIIIFFCIFQS